MNTEIIKAKIEVYAEEANRLIQQNPIVAEFHHHAQRLNQLQAELQKAVEQEEAAKANTETPQAEAPAETTSAKQRKKK